MRLVVVKRAQSAPAQSEQVGLSCRAKSSGRSPGRSSVSMTGIGSSKDQQCLRGHRDVTRLRGKPERYF
jgi:hypothetical protein